MRGDTYSAATLVAELERHGFDDRRVLEAIRTVPRDRFVPPRVRYEAWANRALPIGRGQTISQPYVVALMTAAASLTRGNRVLEIGTGSGYQAAVLAALGCRVYSIERHPALANAAAAVLEVHAPEVRLRVGDGTLGWPEEPPFDAILVTAAAPEVPPALLDQVARAGRLVVPEGDPEETQQLRVYTRQADGGFEAEELCAVRFVPLVRDS